MRNDPCWCGSKKPYCECHMNFDKKIEMYKKKFHKVPPRSCRKYKGWYDNAGNR